MNKTIENKFFEAFKKGGIVDNCIQWIRYTYDLPKSKNLASDESKNLYALKAAKNYYDSLEKKICEEVGRTYFLEYGLYKIDCPLMEEIEANLKECQDVLSRERYVFSMLKYFGEDGCDISRIFFPTGEINDLNREIVQLEKERDLWKATPQGERMRIVNEKLVEAGQHEVVNSYDKEIQRCRAKIEWLEEVNSRFDEILEECNEDSFSVEGILGEIAVDMGMFANYLDAVLLTFGIDLMRLQRECGIYIKEGRRTGVLARYLGSEELAQRYIDALPKEAPRNKVQDVAKALPSEFNTEEGRGWLEKLKQAGYLDSNFQLVNEKIHTKARIALLAECLLEKVGASRKFKILENFWNVKGLSKQRYQSKEYVGKVKGGQEIEELFK